jgi:hypothetical protein
VAKVGWVQNSPELSQEAIREPSVPLQGEDRHPGNPAFRLYFRLGQGFSPEEPDFFVGAGFVKRW